MPLASTLGVPGVTPGLREGAHLQTALSGRGQSGTAVPAMRKEDRSLTGATHTVHAQGSTYAT